MRIAAYRGKSLISKAIKWQTRGIYSHVSVILDEYRIIEAWHSPARVRITGSLSEGHTPGTTVDIFDVKTTQKQDEMITAFLSCQVGKKYDFAGVLRFMSRRNKDNENRWFCSELAFAAFQIAGINLLERIDAYQVDPVTLSTSPLLKLIRQTETA